MFFNSLWRVCIHSMVWEASSLSWATCCMRALLIASLGNLSMRFISLVPNVLNFFTNHTSSLLKLVISADIWDIHVWWLGVDSVYHLISSSRLPYTRFISSTMLWASLIMSKDASTLLQYIVNVLTNLVANCLLVCLFFIPTNISKTGSTLSLFLFIKIYSIGKVTYLL